MERMWPTFRRDICSCGAPHSLYVRDIEILIYNGYTVFMCSVQSVLSQ